MVSAVTVVRNASSTVSVSGGLYRDEGIEGSQDDLRMLNISLLVLSRTEEADESDLTLSTTMPLTYKAWFLTDPEKEVPLLAL